AGRRAVRRGGEPGVAPLVGGVRAGGDPMSEQTWPKNPYDFVPFEETPSAAPDPPGHDRADGLSGRITFDLVTLTPLCILHESVRPGDTATARFANFNGRPVVPASSLKGMLRTVHEAVTNSAVGVLAQGLHYAG